MDFRCPPNPGCCTENKTRQQIFNQPQLQLTGYPIKACCQNRLLPVNQLPTAYGVSLAFTEKEFATGNRDRDYPSSGLIGGMYN